MIEDNFKHTYYKGEQQQYGDYVFREDVCKYCKIIRRVALNEHNKEVIDFFEISPNEYTFTEPKNCKKWTRKHTKKH